jgi:signal transduction histidine kinase
MKRNVFSCCLLFFILCFSAYSQPPDYKKIDSAQKVLEKYDSTSSDYFKTCLFIANGYWDKEAYDTAQIWLDKIAESGELKKNSALHYQYLSAQIKIYYERNLNQLGINECNGAIALAAKLNDSLLLRDGYTMLGNLYYNTESIPLSLECFNKAINYSPLVNVNSQYIGIWGFYEIYQGMSYSYVETKNLDSALSYANLSLKISEQSDNYTYFVDACNLLQAIHFKLNQTDSCLYYASKIDSMSLALHNRGYAILAYKGYIWYYDTRHNNKLVIEYFNKGIALLKSDADINHFYAQEFLYSVIKILKKYRNYPAAIDAIELSTLISYKTLRNAAIQTNGVENAALKKETKILAAELNEAKQKRKANNLVLFSVILVFALAFVVLLWYLHHQKQKLRVTNIKSKISQDLHDDIGASLSSLQIYGTIAEQTFTDNPARAMEMIKKISEQSKTVMENMNDIVWSMKPNAAATTTLEAKIKNYGVELLSDKNISFNYSINPEVESQMQNMLARKNILLIIKEAMNNMAKYSKATQANLQINIENGNCIIRISDNGAGFDTQHPSEGNGLKNMQYRAQELKGTLAIQSSPGKGTVIRGLIPVEAINGKTG